MDGCEEWGDQPMDTNISAYNGQTLLQSQKFIYLPWVLPKPNSCAQSSFARLTIKLEGQDELSIDDNCTVWVTAPPSRKFAGPPNLPGIWIYSKRITFVILESMEMEDGIVGNMQMTWLNE